MGLCDEDTAKKAPRVTPVKSTKMIPTGILCDGCKDVIIMIRQMLIDGAAKEAIEAAVAQMCQSLGPLASVCTSFIDQYIDEIFDWIDQGLDETTICSLIGLCSARGAKSARRAIGKNGRKLLVTDGLCDLCKEGIDYIRQLYIDGYAKEAIEELVNEACDELPAPFSSLCITYIDQYIDQIFDWLDQELDSATICGFLGLCSSKAQRAQGARRAIRSKGHLTTMPTGIFCDTCQEIVHYIEQLLIDGYAKDAIELLVTDVCNDLPSPVSGLCIAVIDLEVENIIAWIELGIDSFNICAQIGICTDSHKKLPKIALKREALSPCVRNPALCAPKPRRPVVKAQ
jgi:saposin